MDRAGEGKSELEALLVETEEGDIDRRLREALEDRVVFERASGRIIVRPGLLKLSQRQRIVALLMARHVLSRLGIGSGELEVDPTILANEAQVLLKNVREYLSKLKREGKVAKGPKGYSVPSWNILLMCDELRSSKGD